MPHFYRIIIALVVVFMLPLLHINAAETLISSVKKSKTEDNTVSLNGTVYEIPDRMDGCNIVVHQNGVPTIFTKSDSEGNFSLKLF